MRKTPILLALAASSVLLTAGCSESNPPCEQLPDPSRVEIQAAREGAEVEREVSGDYADAECVVVGNQWVDQTDDE